MVASHGIFYPIAPVNILRGIVPTQSSWDGQIGKAFQAKTGGTVFTDLTTAANESTANDVPFFDTTMQLNDAFYFGDANIAFNQIKIQIGTSGVYSATLVWEYYNGSAWTTLTTTDATNLLTAAPGTYYVTFTAPGDWAKVAVNSVTDYWVRLRVSAFTSKTTAPLGTQIWLGAAPTSLSNTTDGDFSTVTGTASVNKAASGDYGYVIFDLGSTKTVLVAARIGLWTASSSVTVTFEDSDDNSTYRSADTSISTSATSEAIKNLTPKIMTGRYFRLRFAVNAASATCNFKGYQIMAWELKV